VGRAAAAVSAARGADRRLTVCVTAKMMYPPRVRDQQQDVGTYRALSPWVRRVYVIVTSPGARVRVSHAGNVVALHIPHGPNAAWRWVRFLATAWWIGRKVMRRRRIDLVMAAEPFAGGLVGIRLGRAARVPVVVHIQGDLLDLPPALVGRVRARAMRWLTLRVARRATLVRCISRGVVDACVEAGLDRTRLRLLPIRVDLARFDPTRTGAEGLRVRERLGVAPGALLIVSAGSLTIHKGYSVLLEAFARLRKTMPGVNLVIAGEGPERSRLEADVDRLGLGNAARLPGWMMYADVPALLAASDVYAQPSFDEGIPRAVLEAMAMARPVIASRVGGLPELVREGTTGLLVPPGDPDALAAALARACGDRLLRERFGEAGREAAGEYEMGRAIQQYAELLEEAAGRRAPVAT